MSRRATQQGKLGAWIDAQGWTRTKLAKELKIPFTSMCYFCRDERRPSLEIMVQIEELTNGAVPIRYWLKVFNERG